MTKIRSTPAIRPQRLPQIPYGEKIKLADKELLPVFLEAPWDKARTAFRRANGGAVYHGRVKLELVEFSDEQKRTRGLFAALIDRMKGQFYVATSAELYADAPIARGPFALPAGSRLRGQ